MSIRHPSTILPWATAGVLLLLSALIAIAASAGSGAPERPMADGLPMVGQGAEGAIAAGTDGVGETRPNVYDSPMRVRVEVQDHGRLLPPPSPTSREVVIQRDWESRSGGRRIAYMRFLAGPAAVPGFANAQVGRSLAQFELPRRDGGTGPSFCRIVEGDLVGPRGPLVVRKEVVIEGRVARAPEGDAVAGATVWFGELDAEGRRTGTVRTGDDGSFEKVVRHGSAGIPLVVQADGLASTFRIVDGWSSARREVRVVLEPAATVVVQLGAVVDVPENGRVDLIPESGDSGLRHYPFFLAALDRDRCALDANGECEMDDLPPSGRLRATVWHSELALVREVSIELRSERAESRTILSARNQWSGTRQQRGDRRRHYLLHSQVVSLADGETPIPNARVELAGPSAGPRARGWILPASAHCAGRVGYTDDDGWVELAMFAEPGRARLLVAAEGYCGLEFELSDGGLPDRITLPRADDVVLDAESVAALRFRFEPLGRRFHLRVSDEKGSAGTWREWLDFEEFERLLDAPRLIGLAVRVDLDGGGREALRRFAPRPVVSRVAFDLATNSTGVGEIR